ncbi:ribonuclease H-like protein [Nemania sp. FL0031]|nr:ribonuclease H-like protein [Nemania sp. FL0031]
MTATPPRNDRLWHPSRGVLFSPSPAPLASATQGASQSSRTLAEVSAGVCHQYRNMTTAQSIGVQVQDEAWSAVVTQQTTPPSLSSQKPVEHADADECLSVQPTAETESEVVATVEEAETKTNDGPPPHSSEYKMVNDLFHAAKKSPAGSPESFWSYKLYRGTAEDGSPKTVKVHYCRSKQTMERVCKEFFMHEKVLGFDLEWMPEASKRHTLKQNVSLIQLASPSRIGLFHIAQFVNGKEMIAPSFKTLMEDPSITKLGVSIKGDTTRLRNWLNIESQGLMELSHLYKLVKYSKLGQYHMINKKLVPLAKQVEEYLHLPLYKGQDVRSSNWSKILTWDQVQYSASDAYAGVHLYATLEHYRKQLDPCPPRPHHAELNIAIRLADGVKVADPKATPGGGDVVPTNKSTPISSTEDLAEAMKLVSVEDQEVKTSLVQKKKPAPRALTPKSLGRPKDSRAEVAEDRVASYRKSHPQSRSTPAQLRSYFLWHCYDLSPATVAQLLRDPPLKTITVVGYILSVIQFEKLPVDRDRLREVADHIPQDTLWKRWPVVASMVGIPND